jgi:hypothetical protein
LALLTWWFGVVVLLRSATGAEQLLGAVGFEPTPDGAHLMLSAEAVDVVLLEHSLAALRGLLTVRGPSRWVVHTAELTGISLCDACSCHEILRRNCLGQVSSNYTDLWPRWRLQWR